MAERSGVKIPGLGSRPPLWAVGALAVVVVVVFATVALALIGGDEAPVYSADISTVDPSPDGRVFTETTVCPPDATRLDEPLVSGADWADPDAFEDNGLYVPGQVVPFEIRVEATEAADAEAPPIDLALELPRADADTSGFAEDAPICAYVDASDPATVESEDGNPAEVATRTEPPEDDTIPVDLALTGLDPGEVVVIELLAVAGDIPATNSTNVSVALDVPNPPAATDVPTDPLRFGLDYFARGENVTPTVEITEVTPLEARTAEVEFTITVTNPATSAIMQNADMGVFGDRSETVAGLARPATVEDTIGVQTTCAEHPTEVNSLECDFGYLEPGETVTVNAAFTIADSAQTVFNADDGACDNELGRDMCTQVTVRWQAAASGQSERTHSFEEVTDLPQAGDVRVTKLADDSVKRLGEPVTFSYIFANNSDRAIIGPAVEDPACPDIGDPIAGDDNGDDLLDPGESWTFQCSLEQLTEETATSRTTFSGAFPGGEPYSQQVVNTITILDPEIAISLDDVTDGTATFSVTVTGNDPLSRIVVQPTDNCGAAELQAPDGTFGDLNNNGVLDLGDGISETWRYTCQVIDETQPVGAVVYGSDSRDGAVVDATEAPEG
ncbi:MAG: hypothetical protein S0880_20830 [Actinomycetota bacterium]|nr:hypothetical protein [Actinomycetota bacterium]